MFMIGVNSKFTMRVFVLFYSHCQNFLKSYANGTRCSQAVTHPSTNRAQRCLTSVIGRELVLSTWCGRCLTMGVPTTIPPCAHLCALGVTCAINFGKALFGYKGFYYGVQIGFLPALDESLPKISYDKRGKKAQVIIYSCWFLGSFLLNMAYKSTLRANLITNHYEKPVLTAQDLAASRMKVYVPSGTAIAQSVLDHPSEFYQLVIKQNRLRFYRYGEDCWPEDGVRFGNDRVILGNEDRYLLGGEKMGGSFTTWILTKGSPLREEMTLSVQRLTDAGIPGQLYRLFVAAMKKPKPSPVRKVRGDDEPISLEQLVVMFIVLPFGIIPAILAFTYELTKKS